MAVNFDVANQTCITEYELNNAFIHHQFDYPVVHRKIDGQSVEFILSFRQNVELKKNFCANLTSHHLVYRDNGGNQITLQATHDHMPKFLQSLVLVAENMRHSTVVSVLKRNPSTMFSRQGFQHESTLNASIHNRAF